MINVVYMNNRCIKDSEEVRIPPHIYFEECSIKVLTLMPWPGRACVRPKPELM